MLWLKVIADALREGFYPRHYDYQKAFKVLFVAKHTVNIQSH